MALAAGTHWAFNGGATASNVNGGGFNIANANFITNFTATSANTAAPVISSASYNFVAGDVGAWIFVQSGTNWTPGWYQIASVANNAATVNATIGSAVTQNASTLLWGPSTVVGCATVASPTGGVCGIDFSQGTAAIINDTDLACADGDVAGAVVTSAAKPMSVRYIGNLMHITAGTGWTAGWYEIVSVSTTNATLDRAIGTDGAKSGGTFYVGGALSLGTATDDAVFELMVAGNTVHIKGGTSVTLGGAVSMSNAGTLAATINFIGFNSLRGDVPRGTNRPLFDCGSNQLSIGQYCNIRNLRFTGTTTNVVILQYESKAMNCQFRNTSTVAPLYMLTDTAIFDCEISGARGSCGIDSQGANIVVGCYIHDCDVGIAMQTNLSLQVIDTVFSGCKTAGINFTSTSNAGNMIYGCTFYGAETPVGTGVAMSATTLNVRIMNSIFYGLTSGITHAAANYTNGYGDYNCFFNCTTDATAVKWQKGPNDLAVNPGFGGVSQYTGTTAVTSGGTLVDSGAAFTNVVDGQDYLRLISGTGIVAGQFLITGHTATTLTTSPALPNNATADKAYSVTVGRDFSVGTNVRRLGFPGALPYSIAATTTGYRDIGAIQRQEASTSTGTGGVPHLGPSVF